MNNTKFVLALLIAMAVIYGAWTYLDNVEQTISEPKSEGKSCLPGTDECIDSCAIGEQLFCENLGGTPRECDCNNAWNQ